MSYRWLLVTAVVAVCVRAADPDPLPPPDARAIEKYGTADVIVIGKLTAVQAGPVGLSEPPLYNHRLTFAVESALKGAAKKGDTLTATHTIRQKLEPTFPVGEKCIATLRKTRGGVQATSVEKYDEKALTAIKAVLAVPLGWTADKGKYLSPWARLGKGAWPTGSKLKSSVVCSATGRPALMAGDAVTFTVVPVEPKVKVQFGNPDGDGEYKVTVTNPGKEAAEVPALLTDGKTVLWKECLIIKCQNRTYTLPGAAGVKGDVRPVKLKPGESVSSTVQALALKGPEWPRGGYRIEFTFALGERAETKSFYYLSRHHDRIRDAAQGKE